MSPPQEETPPPIREVVRQIPRRVVEPDVGCYWIGKSASEASFTARSATQLTRPRPASVAHPAAAFFANTPSAAQLRGHPLHARTGSSVGSARVPMPSRGVGALTSTPDRAPMAAKLAGPCTGGPELGRYARAPRKQAPIYRSGPGRLYQRAVID